MKKYGWVIPALKLMGTFVVYIGGLVMMYNGLNKMAEPHAREIDKHLDAAIAKRDNVVEMSR